MWVILCNMMLQTVGMAFKASVVALARQGLFFLPAVALLPLIFGLFGVQTARPPPISSHSPSRCRWACPY